MNPETNLPYEFGPFLADLSHQSEAVRSMWRYAIALMLIDDEKARIVGMSDENGRVMLQVETLAGDKFWIERPVMSEETEKLLLEQIRELCAKKRMTM